MNETLRSRLLEARAFAIVFMRKAEIELDGNNADDTEYRKDAALNLERALMRLGGTE